jgi:hypothetical protein
VFQWVARQATWLESGQVVFGADTTYLRGTRTPMACALMASQQPCMLILKAGWCRGLVVCRETAAGDCCLGRWPGEKFRCVIDCGEPSFLWIFVMTYCGWHRSDTTSSPFPQTSSLWSGYLHIRCGGMAAADSGRRDKIFPSDGSVSECR